MEKEIKFKLFSCCIPVKGYKRYIIVDLQRDDIYFINEGLHEILTLYKELSLKRIKEKYSNEYDDLIEGYMNFLVENELGFFTDEPENFPDIDLQWESPDLITNAVIEYKSSYDLKKVISQLEHLRCKFIELRLYDFMILSSIENILYHFDDSKIRNIDILVRYFDDLANFDFKYLLLKFQRIGNITIHSAPKEFEVENSLKGRIIITKESIDNNSHCGVVDASYFNSNLSLFTEAQLHNSCLNRKIAIDVDGNIKNCPSMPQSYGNIKDTTLREALEHPDFKKYWYIHKDQIEVCKDCEFRYICTDCRAYLEDPHNLYGKPLKCGYNPYTCEWEEWSTNPLKQQAIEYYGMQELVKKETERLGE